MRQCLRQRHDALLRAPEAHAAYLLVQRRAAHADACRLLDKLCRAARPITQCLRDQRIRRLRSGPLALLCRIDVIRHVARPADAVRRDLEPYRVLFGGDIVLDLAQHEVGQLAVGPLEREGDDCELSDGG